MKKKWLWIVLALAFVILCIFMICLGKKKSEKGQEKEQEKEGLFLEETVRTDKLELQITEFRFGELLASTDNDEFLFPTNDTSKILPNGVSFVAMENYTYAVIAYKVKNVSDNAIDLRSITQLKLDYNNGTLFSQELDGGGREPLYVRVNNSWRNIEDFEPEEMRIEKDLSYEFRTCICVPAGVVDEENDLSLLVYTDNENPTFTYKVR